MTGNGSFMRSRGPAGQGMPVSPVRRGRIRKRWVRRLVRIVLVVAGLLGAAVLAQAGWNFLHSDTSFGIRQIHVVGLTRHEPQALRERLADLRGRNLFRLGPQDVSRRIGDLPWLRGFLCRKHLPDTLIVEVVERTQLCSVTTDRGTFEIDGQGVCWPALPGVPGVFRLGTGLDVADGSVQGFLAQLLNLGLAGTVSAVSPGTSSDSYRLTTREGWDVMVTPEDLGAQWKKFQITKGYVAAYLPDRRSLDCRWSGKVVLLPPEKGQDPSQSSAEKVEGGKQNG
jgi:cell division septal protein FtsQ